MTDGCKYCTQAEDELQTAAEAAWPRWLGRVDWQAHVTLTFKHATSPERAETLAGSWIERLEQEVYRQLAYVVVVETSPHVHVHALLAGVGDRFVTQRIDRFWTRGMTHVQEGISSRAVAYVGRKIVTEEHVLLPSNLRTRARRLKWRNRQIRRRTAA